MNAKSATVPGVEVRAFVPEDYHQVLGVWEATGMGGEARGDDLATILHSIKLGGQLLVAYIPGGQIVGTSWMTYDGRRIHLHHVGVLPAYQGKGIGTMLSRESVRFAKEKNTQIKLEVHRTSHKAIGMYKKIGFEYLGDYDVYIIRNTQQRR